MTEPQVLDLYDRLNDLVNRLGLTQQAPARFLTVSLAAVHVSLSEESIRRLLASGKLQAHRPVKGRILIDRIALEQLVLTATTRPRTGRGRRRRNESR